MVLPPVRLHRPHLLVLLLILAVALGFRLWGIGFGLPSVYDPDEPLFVISGLRLIGHKTLDPGWFGHPGTTTIYAIAIIQLLTFGGAYATGMFPSASAFAAAAYLDPTWVVLPARLFIVACGTLCVLLTFLIGRRFFDSRVGLVGAALLAVNPLHIQLSQIVRTDVHASVFMLLCVLVSARIVRHGRTRDHLLAGLCVGLACATKWPAATILAAPLGACLLRAFEHPEERRRQILGIGVVALASVSALFLASPFLLIDYPAVLTAVHGEARPEHLSATGDGLPENLLWYLAEPMRRSVGWLGLGFAAAGALIAGVRSRAFLCTAMAGGAVFLLAVSGQSLIWARWIVPLLPLLSLLIAVALCALGEAAAARFGGRLGLAAGGAALAAIALPMMADAAVAAVVRLHDTRDLAADWVARNVPAGQSVLVEHFAFVLIGKKWRILFPGGDTGCIDATATLQGKIQSPTIDSWRKGRAILDIGTINPARLANCRADYAVFSDYDRYRAEAARFAPELAVYDRMLRTGVIVRSFAPMPGRIGGPMIRIVKLDPRSDFPAR